MTDDAILNWFPYVFPFLFVGMWLAVTTMLGFMSGWFNLQQWYPDDGSEEPLLKLRWQSGMMGAGVSLNNCLTLSAKRSGLSVKMTRIFALFQRPLLIPWSEITAEPSRMFFTPMVKLTFGSPANGKLKIGARSWAKLVAAVPQGGSGAQFHMPDAPAVSSASMARGMFLEWLVLSAFLAAFFAWVTRSEPGPGRLPLFLIAFPVAALAVGQLIRFLRQV
jgi:hypothetical protein